MLQDIERSLFLSSPPVSVSNLLSFKILHFLTRSPIFLTFPDSTPRQHSRNMGRNGNTTTSRTERCPIIPTLGQIVHGSNMGATELERSEGGGRQRRGSVLDGFQSVIQSGRNLSARSVDEVSPSSFRGSIDRCNVR